MRLVQPTDFEILEVLSDGKRNTAVNISYHLDKKRGYINTRLPVLADYGLVTRVGPAPNSGLYEITDRGLAAVTNRKQYDTASDFDAVLDESLSITDG